MYENFEMPSIDDLFEFIAEHPHLRGFNVTIPHKETIFRFLDDIATAARDIGAVNTVVIGDDGYLHGYNTDYIGFRDSLMGWIDDDVSTALVLGTGGASKAVCYTLSEMGIDYLTVSRSVDKGDIVYGDVTDEIITSRELIINCTPIGMGQLKGDIPEIPISALGDQHWIYDLIVNPSKTLFLDEAERHGARIKNGEEMLRLQAECNWQIWSTYL